MILPFSTKINGKPTFFVEKIWKSLLTKHCNLIAYNNYRTEASINNVIDKWDYSKTVNPKIHTIRTDEKDRWKPGILIDYFINCRQKNMFRFAPRIPVLSIQKFEIKHNLDFISIFIDKIIYEIEVCEFSKEIKSTDPVIQQLAQNDGFDTVEAFFEYFNEDYVGKIIHWTDFKY